MNALRLLKLGLSIALVLAFAGVTAPAVAAELKFFSPVNKKRPSSAYMREFAAKATELSGGRVKFDINYPGSLGIEVPDLLRHLKRGFIDAGAIYGPYYNRDAPTIVAAYVEGAISDFAAHKAAVPIVERVYKSTFEKWGIEYVGFVQPPLFDISMFCKKPAKSLADLKGRKVRVWTAHQLETFTRLGISAQIIPQSEMYVALQTGVIDCTFYLGEIAPLMSLNEVAPYESYVLPFAAIPVAIGISKRAMAKLSPADRKAIRDAGKWISQRSLERELARVGKKAEIRAARAKKGFKQLPAFSKQDVATFVSAARAVWLEMAKKAGPESLKAYQLLTK